MTCLLRLAITVLIPISIGTLTGCETKISDEVVQRISVTDAAQRLEKAPGTDLFIDTRSVSQFTAGHVPGARLMQLPDVDPESPDPGLNKYKWLIVYGQNPASAAAIAMAKRLMVAEYSDVKLMEEGFDRWVASGLPTDIAK